MAIDQKWYYSNDGDRQGPVSVQDLQRLAAEGAITDESSLWTSGLIDWVRVTQVDGLFPE